MKMKILITIFYLVLCTSCISIRVPNDIRKRFTYCYDGENTNIEKLININGYYTMGSITDRYGTLAKFEHKIDTMFINLMFYADGTFVFNFFDYNRNIPEFFKEIAENEKERKSNEFFQEFYWGRYIIDGDTIKAQCINHPSLLAPWESSERWYKIIDRNTIQYIYGKPLNRTTKDQREVSQKYMEQSLRNYLPAKFIPVPVRPSSDCWLKKEDWFWCKNRK
jgi:hypothetical protein